jgi:phenylpropionate dioxygenase-like ring-hydroxylating dioxygenase large terminal subunit
VICCHAFGKKLAVFRTHKNQVGVMDARCCHIGADLSRGVVDDKYLVCPLHNWAFDTSGQCRNIPCQNEIPARARQTALPCKEHYGVVYAFLGATPDFELPYFQNTEEYIASRPRVLKFDSAYEMAGANSFDEQHLAAVHKRKVIGKQKITSVNEKHFAIEYRAEVSPFTVYDKLLHLLGKKQVHMSLECWGGNLLLFNHLGTPNRMMISLLPVSEQHSKAFITTVLPRSRNMLSQPYQWLVVRLLNMFTMLFVQQDVKALQGIDFKFTTMLPEADHTMIKWYQYWKKLPRTSFDRLATGNDSSEQDKRSMPEKIDLAVL